MQDVSVSLSDGYDGNANSISVNLSSVDYCPSAPDEDYGDLILDQPTEVMLFPNPVRDILTIHSTGQTSQLKIYSIEGELMRTIPPLVGRRDIDLSQFTPGVYIVRFDTGGEIRTQRLIKL